MRTVEYRVRPVTRYIVTKHTAESDECGESGGAEEIGEFPSEIHAGSVCQAMASAATIAAQPADLVIDGCPWQRRTWRLNGGWDDNPVATD